MSAHPNAEIVRRFFEALSAGDLDASSALLDADIVWHLPCGETVLSERRDVRGLEELGRTTVANITASEGTFRFDVQEVYAGDEYCVAMSRNTARARGRTLEIQMAISMRVIDGRIVEVWEAPNDFDAFVRFWQVE